MASIFDFMTASAISMYWETLTSNEIPYLGPVFFPNRRMSGLRLDWIKGMDNLPVMLMPSAFDAKPTIRDRGEFETVGTRMPFFRESMRIGEEDRQNLLTWRNANPAYAEAIMNRLFDDAGTLISGAEVNSEVMRFELLQTGAIQIQTPTATGLNVNYNYNYDPNGTWAASNFVTLTGTDVWGGTTANPVADILAIKRQASARGVAITRAIVSPAVWATLLETTQIIAELEAYTALTDGELARYLVAKTGITFTVYEKMYKDLSGTEQSFMMDDRVIFLPSSNVGNTYYGTTPEEADLMSGNVDVDVRIVGGGIAVLTKKESLPVNIITSVSEIVLPSYERMNSVYVLKVA